MLLAGLGTLVMGIPLGWSAYTAVSFPSDQTPEGAYLRIALSFTEGRMDDSFPYLEDEAKHAVFTIHEYRSKSLVLIRGHFPESERAQWELKYSEEGDAPDPPAVWSVLAKRHGWDARIRRDLSGIAVVERVGRRATVQTVRGTRYPFRQAENGIWGLTWFTAELVSQKEKAARDHAFIEKAAADYDRAK